MLHVWMSYVTRMNELCHTYEWGMSHIWMRHVTRINESCHTYAHICGSHVIHANESCQSCEWVLADRYKWRFKHEIGHVIYICMSHFTCINKSSVTHMNKSWHTYEWGMSHISASCHTYEWGMSHIWMSDVTNMNEACHTHEQTDIEFRFSVLIEMFGTSLLSIRLGPWNDLGINNTVVPKICAQSCLVQMRTHFSVNPAFKIRLLVMSHMNESCHTDQRVMFHV